MKTLKSTDTNEEAKSGNLFVLLLGCLLIPTGIVMFFTLQNIGGLLYTLLAFVGMAAAIWGIYILIIQLASIGDI